jgi:hypothetical protein
MLRGTILDKFSRHFECPEKGAHKLYFGSSELSVVDKREFRILPSHYQRQAGMSFAQIAAELDARNMFTRTGRAWSAMQVSRILQRA